MERGLNRAKPGNRIQPFSMEPPRVGASFTQVYEFSPHGE
jgi:hypothetical protein